MEDLENNPSLGGFPPISATSFFSRTRSSTAGASPGHEHVYEWAAGKLSQVDVPPAWERSSTTTRSGRLPTRVPDMGIRGIGSRMGRGCSSRVAGERSH